jgi:hypothetical protein
MCVCVAVGRDAHCELTSFLSFFLLPPRYYLRQQLKAIQKELGEGEGGEGADDEVNWFIEMWIVLSGSSAAFYNLLQPSTAFYRLLQLFYVHELTRILSSRLQNSSGNSPTLRPPLLRARRRKRSCVGSNVCSRSSRSTV